MGIGHGFEKFPNYEQTRSHPNPQCGPEVGFWENPMFTGLEFGNIVLGAFTPVMAQHSKSFNLIDTFGVGVDRIQRNFEPMQRQVE